MRYLGSDINRMGDKWTVDSGLNIGHGAVDNVK